jgi:hypothetical protein
MHEDAWQAVSALGLTREKPRHLLLVPLAYVAAASRRRDLALLDRLIESSAQAAKIDAEGVALARAWLSQPPAQDPFQQALGLLRLHCESNDGSLAVRDLIESVLWACSAAQLDRERIGRRYTPVSTSARRAIGELELALGVEVGDLWADVLEELGDELPRSRNVVPPRLRGSPESRRGRPGAEPPPSSLSRPGG